MGVFNKTIIPLALVGYEMIIANSYPTRPRGIIVKYFIFFVSYILSAGKCKLYGLTRTLMDDPKTNTLRFQY